MAGFDELKSGSHQQSFSLMELSTIQGRSWIREKIGELVKEIYKPHKPVMEIVEKCSQYIFNNFNILKRHNQY